MILNVKQYAKEVGEGKWVKVSEAEAKAIIESIPGENLERANATKSHSGLRHYVDRGYIVVHDTFGVAETHPLDLPAEK